MIKLVVGMLIGGFIVHLKPNIVNDIIIWVCSLTDKCL